MNQTIENSSAKEAPSTNKKGNKLTLIIILLLMIGPFFIVPLFVDPFSVARKAHGALVQPSIDIGHIELLLDDQPSQKAPSKTALSKADENWKLFYVMPNNCTKACEHSILQMERVRRSMDKLMDKVTLIAATTRPLSSEWQQRAKNEFMEIEFTQLSPSALSQIQAPLNDVLYGRIIQQALDKGQSPPKHINAINAGHLYLLSPDAHIVVHYPPIEDEREAILYAKGIRKDLRKSIKGAR